LSVCGKTDRFSFGQCARASVGKVSGGSPKMDGKRFVYLLFAEIFTASESGRNLLAQSQIRMAQTN